MGIVDDLVARELEQIASLLASARDARKLGHYARASAAVDEAWARIGLDRRFLQRLDAGEAVAVVRSQAKLRWLASLVLEEAELLAQQGDPDSASATARWAHDVVRHLRLPDTADVRELLARLSTLTRSP